MSTKKALSDAPGAEVGEFDVRFGDGELGLRLEERGSFEASSVVVKITEGGERKYFAFFCSIAMAMAMAMRR